MLDLPQSQFVEPKAEDEDEDEEQAPDEEMQLVPYDAPPPLPQIDPALLDQGILVGTTRDPLFLPDADADEHDAPPLIDANIDPDLLAHDAAARLSPSDAQDPALGAPPTPDALDETVDDAVAQELVQILQNSQGLQLASALDEAEERRVAQFTGDDELRGLDEDELDRFILTEEEVRVKERVWVEINRDYLEALAGE